MRRVILGLVLGCAFSPALADEPIVLRGMGSFHIGGRVVEITGKPVKEVIFTPGGVPAKVDLNGSYQAEQMYVQYFLPQKRSGKVPLLMWHGGGLTGVSYETTPDGREGWLNMFIRKGWDVYNSDAVERGRASWAMFPDIFAGEPLFLNEANAYERFRIGGGEGIAIRPSASFCPAINSRPRPTRISSSRSCRAGPPPTPPSSRLTRSSWIKSARA